MVSLRVRLLCVQATVVALAFGPFAACSPDLREGVYGCDPGPCPEGWFCHGDHLCYSRPEDAGAGGSGGTNDAAAGGTSGADSDAGSGGGQGGMSSDSGSTGDRDAATPDAAPPQDEPYAPCVSSATCGSGLGCAFGPDPTADDGYCTRTCTADGDCPPLDGRAARCLEGTCLPSCSAASDCDGGYGCYHLPTGMMQGENACFEIADAALFGTEACQMPPMSEPIGCDSPGLCLFHAMFDPSAGVCSLHCDVGMPSTECPGGGRCVEAFEGVTQCLAPCSNAGECDAGLSCAAFGPGGNVCVPTGWVGEQPPLPMPMMMP